MYLTAPIPAQLGVLKAQLKKENIVLGAAHLECVTLKPIHILPIDSAYCFEQDRPVLRLVLSPDAGSQTVYNTVVEFQGHFVARDVRVTYQKKTVLAIHVDEMGNLSASAAAEFNPPPDATGPIVARVVPEETMTSLVLAQVPPIYPPNAKEMHVEGTIILHIIVGKDGAVKDAEAISGPAALRGAAVAAVRQWIFRPFEILGKPTEVETNVRVTFTLS
jgi:protein TonB